MTIEEIKKLIESTLIIQKEVSIQQKELSAQQREFSAQRKEISKEWDREIKELKDAQRETEAQIKDTSEQMKKTDEQMKKTDEKLKRMGITLGNVTNNNGEIAEEFFYTSFNKKKELGGIRYDDVERNWRHQRNNIKEEYDIIMINGKSIAVLEVKAKAHENDIEKLERRVGHFKKLYPMYKKFSVYGGLASLVLTEVVEEKLINKGFFAIKQQGDHVVVHSPKSFYVPKKYYPPKIFVPRVF